MRGLLVGRFQPFHRGHLGVVTSIRSARPDEPLLLGIGSAQASHTALNPFTAGERFEMIDRALSAAQLSAYVPVPLVDIDRHGVWVAHLETLLPPFGRVYTNNPLTRTLFERGGYPVESPQLIERERFQGEAIRRRMAEGNAWEPLVPPAVATYLKEIRGAERVQLLAGIEPRPRPEA